MQTIAANPAKPSVRQLFSYPFRIFFLSLTLIAIVFVPLWVLVATGVIQPPLAMPGILWHQHEMLFGFLSAAIAGFLLTAVCVWTNTERDHFPQRGSLSRRSHQRPIGGRIPDMVVSRKNGHHAVGIAMGNVKSSKGDTRRSIPCSRLDDQGIGCKFR